MPYKSIYNKSTGCCDRVLRNDAEKYQGRYVVPTTPETYYVQTWTEFQDAGGTTHFNEDQTEIELLLPEGYKFGISFPNGRFNQPRRQQWNPHVPFVALMRNGIDVGAFWQATLIIKQ